MTEQNEAKRALAEAAEEELPETPGGEALDSDEVKYAGRYLPYSGGSAGWYENEGVPKCEQGNNYGFHTAVNRERVLQKRFERLGAEVGRRQAMRRKAVPPPPLSLEFGGRKMDGLMMDFSAKGLRARVLSEPGLSAGDQLTVRVQPSEFFKTELALFDAEVRWVRRIDQDGVSWHIGISFTPA